jgi:hypothetical protein
VQATPETAEAPRWHPVPMMVGHFPGAGEIPEDGPEFKGTVVIEWPRAATKGARGRLLPGALMAVYDEDTGALIPCASVTVRGAWNGFLTADVAVYLGERGEILHDPQDIGRTDGIPATFPFLVAEMRVRQ